MTDIQDIIKKELKKLSVDTEGVFLEHPKDLKNGDYSFFVKDKDIDTSKLKLDTIKSPYIEKTSVSGRFINFYLSGQFFADSVLNIIEKDIEFGKNKKLEGKEIIIEYTDPNPFKEFHVGHLMSNTIGESLSRIIEWSGANVKRACYQGDVGPHVAKTIWAIKKEGFKAKDLTMDYLGKMYVVGSNAYETDEKHALDSNQTAKTEIEEINKKIYEKSDPEINKLYETGKKICLDHFEEIYRKLGTNFDYKFFESETAPIGMFIVEELFKKGILEKSEGAVIFKGEQYGLHTRVFVTSQGLPTYETKELGLSKIKFDRADFDQSIVVTAHEQADYFDVVLKVLKFVDHRAADRTKHISHGILRFSYGKMSSRKGNVITAESLIEDVKKLVYKKIEDRELTKKEKNNIAEQTAIGAIKYSILKQSPGKDIIFDFDKSLSFEGDSGPYLQYTHARAQSVLKKAKKEKIIPKTETVSEITEVGRLLYRLEDVIERAKNELAPQYITTYLIQLASAFNSFYAKYQIVNKGEKNSSYRIALTQAVEIVLKNGLYLLGIKAPDKM